jgi:hypothetical protein
MPFSPKCRYRDMAIYIKTYEINPPKLEISAQTINIT